MTLSYGNLVRGLYLLLFSLSSSLCLFKPSTHSGLIAILSLVGFIAFDLICQLKRKDVPDLSKEFAGLKEKNEHLEQQFRDIKDNISVGSIASAIKRR